MFRRPGGHPSLAEMACDPHSDALTSKLEGCHLIPLHGHEARLLTQPPEPFLNGHHIMLRTAIRAQHRLHMARWDEDARGNQRRQSRTRRECRAANDWSSTATISHKRSTLFIGFRLGPEDTPASE